MKNLISKRTRNEFREFLSFFSTLEQIDIFFDGAHLSPKKNMTSKYECPKKNLTEQYYANVNFDSSEDVRKILDAFADIIQKNYSYEYHGTQQLIESLRKDGFHYNEKEGTIPYNLIDYKINIPTLSNLQNKSIHEHLDKLNDKMNRKDYSGAISTSYTLTEEFFKFILKEKEIPFKQEEGNIQNLYNFVRKALNLDPSGKQMESCLKPILEGFIKQVQGLYSISNKAGDRHSIVYKPSERHAKLVVNLIVGLCEFIYDSYVYQNNKLKENKTSFYVEPFMLQDIESASTFISPKKS